MIVRISSLALFLLFFASSSNGMEQRATFKDLKKIVHERDSKKVREFLKDDAVRDKINSVDYDGRTLVHFVALNNLPDIARVLLRAGADPIRRDRDGLSPLDLAISSGSVEVLDVLLEFCNASLAAITERNPITDLTLLQAAIYTGENSLPIIRTLVEHHNVPVTPEDIHIVKTLERDARELANRRADLQEEYHLRSLAYRKIRSYLKQQRINQRSSNVPGLQPTGYIVVGLAHQHIDQSNRVQAGQSSSVGQIVMHLHQTVSQNNQQITNNSTTHTSSTSSLKRWGSRLIKLGSFIRIGSK